MDERLELLGVEAHGALRMHARAGGHPHFVMIAINEFARAAATCPIFLAKDSTSGEFYAGAMFGFRPGETLVDGLDGEDAPFRPLDLQRQGFFIAGEHIAIDPLHPRFGAGASIALFESGGQPSAALRQIQRAIGQLKAGTDATGEFIRDLLDLRIIEPVDIALSFDDGERLRFDGLYTVSKDGLAELDDAQILNLFRRGHLQAAYCMIFSVSQIGTLARRRNQRLAGLR